MNKEILITGNYDNDVKKLDEILHIDESYDLLKRQLMVGNKRMAIYFINGFCKEDLMQKIQEYFIGLKVEDVPDTVEEFEKTQVPLLECKLYDDRYNIITNILSGVAAIVVDGYKKAILLDVREYPSRSVQEPEKYKVLRGSRDGFVETLVLNTALIRRRIRNPEYMCEVVRVGDSSRTDIAICYMSDRADMKLVDNIKERINKIDVDALSMNQESLSECLHNGHWYNPFPKFRYTERPDTVAASVLEGQIAILVDNSPAAMLLPTTIFDVIEEADDYYFPPITGTYLRLARTAITILSLVLTPLFLMFSNNPDLIPKWLEFTQIQGQPYIPIYWQMIILELAVDGLKLAAINTPSTLNTPLSLIAAIIIGEFTVNIGWFNEQTMLYMAVVAIANFTHENYELAYSIKFLRILILTLTQLFGPWGLIAGLIITVITIAVNQTMAKTSYIYPLIPFNFKKFMRRFFRVSIKNK